MFLRKAGVLPDTTIKASDTFSCPKCCDSSLSSGTVCLIDARIALSLSKTLFKTLRYGKQFARRVGIDMTSHPSPDPEVRHGGAGSISTAHDGAGGDGGEVDEDMPQAADDTQSFTEGGGPSIRPPSTAPTQYTTNHVDWGAVFQNADSIIVQTTRDVVGHQDASGSISGVPGASSVVESKAPAEGRGGSGAAGSISSAPSHPPTPAGPLVKAMPRPKPDAATQRQRALTPGRFKVDMPAPRSAARTGESSNDRWCEAIARGPTGRFATHYENVARGLTSNRDLVAAILKARIDAGLPEGQLTISKAVADKFHSSGDQGLQIMRVVCGGVGSNTGK